MPFVELLDANGYITGRTGKGVSPFQYARDENDSLWRANDAAGIAHSNIRYEKGTPGDERTAEGISMVNYFENFKYFMENVRGKIELLKYLFIKKNQPFDKWKITNPVISEFFY